MCRLQCRIVFHALDHQIVQQLAKVFFGAAHLNIFLPNKFYELFVAETVVLLLVISQLR